MRISVLVRMFLLMAALLLVLSAPRASAAYGDGDPRLQGLYASFISPCCWRENLTVHNSPEAVALRARIGGMVATGESDQEIKDTLVAEYGARILSLPEGPQRLWLFWTPVGILTVGLAGLLLYLRRTRLAATSAPGANSPVEQHPIVDFPADWD